MPNHQARRTPLPADYQHPTHGVDCDCVTCRNRFLELERIRAEMAGTPYEYFGLPESGWDAFKRRYDGSPALEPTAETPWAV